MKHWHLISYDVRDPKRLRKVAKMLEGYGTRIGHGRSCIPISYGWRSESFVDAGRR